MIEEIKVWEKKLFKDFQKRWSYYSGLGWKNRKGLWKSTVQWQVPAFAIRLVSDKALAHLKNFPELQEEISKISLIFQYIKYKPKEAARKWAANYLNQAKYQVRWINIDRKRRWYKAYKMPTRESLGINQKMEEFKANYPKILIRKADWTIDYIKSDWSWYLTTMVNVKLLDKQVVWNDFFFKHPATLKATNKKDIEDRLFRKIKKILDRIEQIINIFKHWNKWDLYKTYKKEVIRMAKSLTLEWLNYELELKKKKLEEKDLWKNLIIYWNNEEELNIDDFWDLDTPIKKEKIVEKKVKKDNPFELNWKEI